MLQHYNRGYSKITFTPYDFPNKKIDTNRDVIVYDFIAEVEINKSHQNLTSTAKITIPRKVKYKGKPVALGLTALFRRGDKVKIELGYYPDLTTVYEGYISTVSVNSPIVINCEDEMFILKQKPILFPLKYRTDDYTKTGKKRKAPKIIPTVIPLKEFLEKEIVNGTGIPLKCNLKTDLYVIRFDTNCANALNRLKQEFPGLYAYMQDGALNVGFLSDASETKQINFGFETTIINPDSLEYQRKEDVRVGVTVESIDPITNVRIKDFVGDPDGAQKKSFTTLYLDKASLHTYALAELDRLKYEGYRGEFLTFGEPNARPGDKANLTSYLYPEKNGVYLIQSVNIKYGVDIGYKQEIELGTRIGF